MRKIETRCADASILNGSCIDGYFISDDYWHLYVVLRIATDENVVVFNHETRMGKYFEVSPIDLKRESTSDHEFKEISPQLHVNSVIPLWRTEWDESVPTDQARFGAGPHFVQTGGPIGSAPSTATNQCDLLAGLLIRAECGREIVVYTWMDNPLNTEIALVKETINEILAQFTLGDPNDFTKPPSSNDA